MARWCCFDAERPGGILGAAALLAASFPAAALACPVCFSGGDPAADRVYLESALGLTVLPFVVLGAIAAVLWRRRGP
jgi:hypothetical protein